MTEKTTYDCQPWSNVVNFNRTFHSLTNCLRTWVGKKALKMMKKKKNVGRRYHNKKDTCASFTKCLAVCCKVASECLCTINVKSKGWMKGSNSKHRDPVSLQGFAGLQMERFIIAMICWNDEKGELRWLGGASGFLLSDYLFIFNVCRSSN